MKFNELLKIGHRGAMKYAVENSRESINKALESKANMIEIDVRYTKDDIPVVFHDEEIDRLMNGKGKISEMVLEELNQYKLKNGEKILTLEELLLTYLENCLVNLELKEDKISDGLIKILSKFDVKRILFSSFYHSNVLEIKKIFNEIKTAALLVGKPLDLKRIADETRSDYLDLNYEFVDIQIVKELQNNGIGVVIWKINDLNLIKKFFKLGIDGIISDDPSLFNKIESLTIIKKID